MTSAGYKEYQDLLDKYKEDVKLSYENIDQKTFLAPSVKAKWVGEYHGYKHELNNERKKLTKLRIDEQKIIKGKLKIDLSEREIAKLKLKANNETKLLVERIEDLTEILDFLDDCRSFIRYYNNDISNALKVIDLDT